ncbi:MAG TPA: ABC transporter ATP-binding protein [Phycisphaeraceae bacterium]|nr:ABC transporter ATP-binding protein [Phycisphaeraceae bacterium]
MRESPLLQVRDLAVSFTRKGGGKKYAVDGISFTVFPRQTLAVVGESGCGKSVTAMSILQLVPDPPGRTERGEILFRERDLLQLDRRQMRSVRGNEIAMIFQEPMSSLNPVYTIGEQISETVRLHQKVSRRRARDITIQALRDVGIKEPEIKIRQYPHQFSGGMRQRVMIAMALACEPAVLLADEPTTALDVTVQAQILNLLRDIKKTRGMGIILISHDLGIVAQQADVVCVVYAGHVVEYATVYELFRNPLHPYTRGLLASIPKMDRKRKRLKTIDELLADPEERLQIPGNNNNLIPWWPRHLTNPTTPTTPTSSPAIPTSPKGPAYPATPTKNPTPKNTSGIPTAPNTEGSGSGPKMILAEVEPLHWVGLAPGKEADKYSTGVPIINFRRKENRNGKPADE